MAKFLTTTIPLMIDTALNAFNKILVLAPHPDDGEFGCGATIHRLINMGKEVHYIAFSTCEESVPEGFPKNILSKEVKAANKVLGIPSENLHILNYRVRHFPSYRQEILEDLVKYNKQLKPNLVFCPSSFDIHQDHQTISQETKRAFKNITILGYEFIWNNFQFSSQCFIEVFEKNILKKISSLECYQSQSKRLYAKDKLIKSIANYRGLQVQVEYAEAFESIRWIIN